MKINSEIFEIEKTCNITPPAPDPPTPTAGHSRLSGRNGNLNIATRWRMGVAVHDARHHALVLEGTNGGSVAAARQRTGRRCGSRSARKCRQRYARGEIHPPLKWARASYPERGGG